MHIESVNVHDQIPQTRPQTDRDRDTETETELGRRNSQNDDSRHNCFPSSTRQSAPFMSTSIWSYVDPSSDEVVGPVPLPELRVLLSSGKISSSTLFWKDGQPDWLPLCDLVDLKAKISPPQIRGVPPVPAKKWAPKPPPKKNDKGEENDDLFIGRSL